MINRWIGRWMQPLTWVRFATAVSPREIYRQRYLMSPRWLSLRLLARALYGKRCKCGRIAVDTHHVTYSAKGEPGIGGYILEFLSLQPLCRKCHEEKHR